jgi:hypothetical protein
MASIHDSNAVDEGVYGAIQLCPPPVYPPLFTYHVATYHS